MLSQHQADGCGAEKARASRFLDSWSLAIRRQRLSQAIIAKGATRIRRGVPDVGGVHEQALLVDETVALLALDQLARAAAACTDLAPSLFALVTFCPSGRGQENTLTRRLPHQDS